MSERLTNLAETAYTDDELFALEAIQKVVVGADLTAEFDGDFNSEA